MGQVNLPSNILDRVKRVEQQIAEIRKAIGLTSATITHGDLTIRGGSLVIQDSGSIDLPLGGTVKDALGNIIFSADQHTGQRLSTPFLAVPMTPKWKGGVFQTDTGVGDYAIVASDVTAETTLWQGNIPQVVHPRIGWSGVIGRITGTTSTPTYRLYVNGTLVGSPWSQTGYGGYNTPQFDITGITSFGSENVRVTLSIQADVSSTDNLACGTYSAYMCGQ